MLRERILLVFGCILYSHSVVAVWRCTEDSDCSSLADGVCVDGTCLCPPGKQAVLGGTACVDLAPYHTSPCVENFQCSRMLTAFQCNKEDNSTNVGQCSCQPDHHYFLGRCWRSADFEEPCTHDEQCMGVLRDPYSMSCNQTCGCSEGYYLRQRGECRKSAFSVGEGCVINEDCQFENGACDIATFQCVNTNVEEPPTSSNENKKEQPDVQELPRNLARIHGLECNSTSGCEHPFECSSFGVCLCPVGYYPNGDGSLCLAELGSPASWSGECVGFFTEIRDGICSCQNNFYFESNMRSCFKATTRITDSCLSDENCHTFGASARCGEPQQWGIRTCECVTEDAVWDQERQMCRLFAGVGESCQVDSDCLAGNLEIQCVANEEGQGICSCPPGYVTSDGLCLTLGLVLGDSCQISRECDGTPNAECAGGVCSCGNGYQQVEDICAPIIGGSCSEDSDCVIANTTCSDESNTCQCRSDFVEYEDSCWLVATDFGASCDITEQCLQGLGEGSSCVDGQCECSSEHHFRDGRCWPRTGLFEVCRRSSECFLGDQTNMVQCRNGLCQCTFEFPYSEELRTCTSSAMGVLRNSFTILIALIFIYLS